MIKTVHSTTMLRSTIRTCLGIGLAMTALGVNAATLVNNVKGYTLDNSGKLTTFNNLVIDHGKVVAANV
ncbi:MAG: hypothetical protein VXZ36_12885, partial [Pseudomonadota bacterium]|nr:hypothetical protein [Pseudomonadota bacterium]